MQLRDVNPGVRVYVPLWDDKVLYEVQSMPRHSTDIDVVSEEDSQVRSLPAETQVVICEEDDVVHEYRANCNCADCTDRRFGSVEEQEV